MKKKAIEIKKGDTIVVGGEDLEIIGLEVSDVSKQGTKKVRLETKKSSGEKVVIVRPADYPLEVKE